VPNKVASNDTVPNKVASNDTVPNKVASNDTVPNKIVLDDTTPSAGYTGLKNPFKAGSDLSKFGKQQVYDL